MRGDRRRIKVEDHLRGRRPRRPSTRSGLRARRAQAIELGLADRQQHSPRRRDRRHRPEQRRLRAQSNQIRHAAPAIGQHHRQIAEHPPRLMRRAALARLAERPTERVGQPQPLGRQRQQRGARPRRQPGAVRTDFYLLDAGTSHHLQGAPPERERRVSTTTTLPAQADVLARPASRSPLPTGESRLGIVPQIVGPQSLSQVVPHDFAVAVCPQCEAVIGISALPLPVVRNSLATDMPMRRKRTPARSKRDQEFEALPHPANPVNWTWHRRRVPTR
jgi:hypothetical protein